MPSASIREVRVVPFLHPNVGLKYLLTAEDGNNPITNKRFVKWGTRTKVSKVHTVSRDKIATRADTEQMCTLTNTV